MVKARLLVVDDEPAAAEKVKALLCHMREWQLETAHGAGDALNRASTAKQRREPFDVILLDYHLKDTNGVEVMTTLQAAGVDARMIFMSTKDLSELSLSATSLGTFDFISKPINRAELTMRVELALRDRRAKTRERPSGARRPRKSDVIIGRSPAIKELYERMSMVAPTDVTIALSGESGTGKELVARTIHNISNRYQGPFVVVNCAAIPEPLLESELFGHVKGAFTDASRDRDGLFSVAHTGTLFLDEIGEMPLLLQAKVLRVLQSLEFRRIGDNRSTYVDVRIITATNRDLEQAVKAGRFREDLYYRINVFPIVLAPLRERREDIPLLAHHFLLLHRSKVGKLVEGFSAAAMNKLQDYDFLGNVRELENKVYHALVLAQGKVIQPKDVPVGKGVNEDSRFDVSRRFRELKREVVETFEREYIRELLRVHHGNMAAASRQAGMNRKNLWALAKKYQIDPDCFRYR